METIAELNKTEDKLKVELLKIKTKKEELSKSLEGLKEVYEGKYFKEERNGITSFFHVKEVISNNEVNSNRITIYNPKKIEMEFFSSFYGIRNLFEEFKEEISEKQFLRALTEFNQLVNSEYKNLF